MEWARVQSPRPPAVRSGGGLVRDLPGGQDGALRPGRRVHRGRVHVRLRRAGEGLADRSGRGHGPSTLALSVGKTAGGGSYNFGREGSPTIFVFALPTSTPPSAGLPAAQATGYR